MQKVSRRFFNSYNRAAVVRVLANTYRHERWKEGEGGPSPLNFEIISKKKLVFQFRGVKTKFHHFRPPHGKDFGKIPYCPPPWKKSFRRPCL